MDDKKENTEYIDLRVEVRKLWRHKKTFFMVWIATFVLACAYILPQPRTYTTELMLAPELGGESAGGTISSLASSFGVNLGSIEANDALYPELYPDLISSNEFLVNLLYMKVITKERMRTTYLDYLKTYHRKNPVVAPLMWVTRQLNSLFEEPDEPLNPGRRLDSKHLTKEQDRLVDAVRQNITCDVDVKTNVITVTVKEQDPLVCVAIADSTCAALQDRITRYRTGKAKVDMVYFKKLMKDAKCDYDASVEAYSEYADAHKGAVLQSCISQQEKLRSEMESRLSNYNAMQAQYIAARAKVQERTPSFTILKAADVPVKPTGPKRMIFVAAMLFLSTIATIVFLYKKRIV